MTVWYTTCGFGGTPTPVGPWKDPAELCAAIRRWRRRVGYRAGELVSAHSIHVNGYRTRTAARCGDISDGPGSHGCVEIYGLDDFMFRYGRPQDDPYVKNAELGWFSLSTGPYSIAGQTPRFKHRG